MWTQCFGKKNYTTAKHFKKILKSLSKKCRPKIIAIEQAMDLNTLALQNYIIFLKKFKMNIIEKNDIALKSKSEKKRPKLCKMKN